MNIIEFDRWKPSSDDPRRREYVGQRTGLEVFEELKHRLESQGYLPDEYFEIRPEWEKGKEIPKEADLFCTVDYGASEGVYVDVYLKWYDQKQKKSITSSFIVGKTLGENGNDLDRMFLTASAITKAVHGDHATHTRYMKIDGVEDDTGGSVVHLSQQEQRTIIKALVEQRERQENAMSQTEQLLRRMTGSITEYMNTVGRRPLHMSDYDKAMLAIRDGEVDAFLELYPKLLNDHANNLFVAAAERPGAVGRSMMRFLLVDVEQFSEQVYSAACKKAIDINDAQKVASLLANAGDRVQDLSPSFHGEMAVYAHQDHRFIAKEIIKQCTNEQIAAAPSYLMEQFASDGDYRTMSMLVEKGISGGPGTWRMLHTLTYEGRDSWMAESLLQKRMWVKVDNYRALDAVIHNDAVSVGKLLLDGGMDFDEYLRRYPDNCNEETIRALTEHWNELQAQAQESVEPEQAQESEIGGMNLG